MTERPIPFSGPMVQAILAGTKTQTRRLSGLEDVNAYPGRLDGDGPLGRLGYRGLTPNDGFVRDKRAWKRSPGLYHWFLGQQPGESNPIPVRCPYGVPGDRLWVRETFRLPSYMDDRPAKALLGYYPGQLYGVTEWPAQDHEAKNRGRNRPGRFMPRELSRLTLEVTEVRVQRLQDISPADIDAEGCRPDLVAGQDIDIDGDLWPAGVRTVRLAFQELWDSLNAKRAPWDSNPWVWAVTFRRAA